MCGVKFKGSTYKAVSQVADAVSTVDNGDAQIRRDFAVPTSLF